MLTLNPNLGGIFSLHLNSIRFKSGLLSSSLLASAALNLMEEKLTPTPDAKSKVVVPLDVIVPNDVYDSVKSVA